MAALNQTLIGVAITIDYGVCEFPTTFGEVVSGSVKLTCDKQEWENCRGNVKLILLRNQRYEMQLEVEFDSALDLPALGDDIAFPFWEVTGQVLDAEIKGSRTERIRMSINATHWIELGSSPTVTQLEG